MQQQVPAPIGISGGRRCNNLLYGFTSDGFHRSLGCPFRETGRQLLQVKRRR